MAQLNFDASKVDPQDSFSALPAGTYVAVIESTEVKGTKTGSGQYIKAKYRIIDGQHKNRVIFGNINVVNANKQAEEIGQRQLSSLCHAVGVLQLQDTQQLHNKPVKIKVKVRVDESGKYDDSNDISGFEQVGNASPASTAAEAAQAAPPAPSAPWAKK